jgi:acetylornithine deacetylase/succinyl-diaminopimelate desuccinylase-like protein
MDTVPAGDFKKWTKNHNNPWKAVIKGGYLYGLGSADDKGPLVAILHAVSLFKSKEFKRPLFVLATFVEEIGMPGAFHVIRQLKKDKPCMAYVGEPSSLKAVYRHKGMGVVVMKITSSKALSTPVTLKTVDFKGRGAHSSRP